MKVAGHSKLRNHVTPSFLYALMQCTEQHVELKNLQWWPTERCKCSHGLACQPLHLAKVARNRVRDVKPLRAT